MRPVLIALALSACTTPTGEDPDVLGPHAPCAAPEGTGGSAVIGAHSMANPIVPQVPLFPWPSDQYLVADAALPSGRRVELPETLLPDGMTTEMFAADDGFSRVVPILTFFPGGIDPTSLPDWRDEEATTLANSPVLLVESGTCRLIPLLVEPDAGAVLADQETLILRPHVVLKPATQYTVVVRNTLRNRAGDPVQPSAAFVALRDRVENDDPVVEAWRGAFHTVRATLEDLEIPAEEVAQAWTFTTRSEANVVTSALQMQDIAAAAPLDRFTLEEVRYEPEPNPEPAYDRALIYGTFGAPWFLDANRRMVRDAEGRPVVQEIRDIPFLITIPSTVSGPREGVLVGHGFFSSLDEPTYGNMFSSLELWQRPAFSTKFYGFAEEDLLVTVGVLGGLADADTIVHQQLQSHVNFTILHRLATDVFPGLVRVDFGAGEITPLDGGFLPYIGASNGGTQGLVMMTTSPVITRGALVVPGGGWSHMLTRAVQWQEFGPLFESRFPDPRELQLVMGLVQNVLDPVDSLNYVAHLTQDRYEGRGTEVQVLAVEAKEDSQVANLVTHWVAREAGLPLLTPSPIPVWGLESAERPDPGVENALVIYDLGAPSNPEGNVPPDENGVHGAVRTLLPYKEQVGTFLSTGLITHPCDGACDPD